MPSNFTLHRAPLRYTGQVGVPGKGERICRHCEGSGHDLGAVRDRYSVCGICEGTGVLPNPTPETPA